MPQGFDHCGPSMNTETRSLLLQTKNEERKTFINETRENVGRHLEKENLLPKKVYIVCADAILAVVNNLRSPKAIDEADLLNDVGEFVWKRLQSRYWKSVPELDNLRTRFALAPHLLFDSLCMYFSLDVTYHWDRTSPPSLWFHIIFCSRTLALSILYGYLCTVFLPMKGKSIKVCREWLLDGWEGAGECSSTGVTCHRKYAGALRAGSRGAVSDDIKNARHLNFVEGERGDEWMACILGIACRRVSALRTQCFTVQMGDKDQYLWECAA